MLFEDDFDNDITGWHCADASAFSHNSENGYLVLKASKDSKVVYNGEDFPLTVQAGLSDYIMRCDIKNSGPNFRFFFNIRNGYRGSFRDYGNGAFYGALYKESMQSTVFTGEILAAKKDTEYVKYIKDPVLPISVAVSAIGNKQVLYSGSEKIKEQNFTDFGSGSFAFTTTGSSGDVLIDNFKVYKPSFSAPTFVPVITDPVISGEVAENSVITAGGTYSHGGGVSEGTHTYYWYASDKYDGDYEFVSKSNSPDFTVTAEYVDKCIKCVIVPHDSQGTFGKPTQAAAVCKPSKPVAYVKGIKGTAISGNTLELEYDFYDNNPGDVEQNSKFNWYISAERDANYTEIPNETQKQLLLKDEYQGKYIKAEVIPVSSSEPFDGDAVLSEPVYMYNKPVASDVRINSMGNNIYLVSYKYESPDNAQEGSTKIEWYVNDSLIGTGASVSVSSSTIGILQVKVSPCIKDLPLYGNTVSAAYNIKPSSGGTGGGGGGGGSMMPTKPGNDTVEIIKIGEIPEETKIPKFNDLANHWALDYAEKVSDKGIMSGSDKGNFFPELTVSRAEFVTYLMKAIEKNTESYDGTFKDISADDWFAGYVQSALYAEVVSESENFNPYDSVTREQVCKMAVQALGIEVKDEYDLSMFNDSQNISDWAKPYVAAAVEAGIIQGVGNNEFAPDKTLDRGQTAALMAKILEYLED